MSEIVLGKILEEYQSRDVDVRECVLKPDNLDVLKLIHVGRTCFVSASLDSRFEEETHEVVQSTGAIGSFVVATVAYLEAGYRFPHGTNSFEKNREIVETRAGEMRVFFRNGRIKIQNSQIPNLSVLAALDKQNTAPLYDKYELGKRKGMN